MEGKGVHSLLLRSPTTGLQSHFSLRRLEVIAQSELSEIACSVYPRGGGGASSVEFRNLLAELSDISKCDGKNSEKSEKRKNETSDWSLQGFHLSDYHKGLCLCYTPFRFSIPLILFFFHNRIIWKLKWFVLLLFLVYVFKLKVLDCNSLYWVRFDMLTLFKNIFLKHKKH